MNLEETIAFFALPIGITIGISGFILAITVAQHSMKTREMLRRLDAVLLSHLNLHLDGGDYSQDLRGGREL